MEERANVIEALAPAKVNLYLRVVGKRADGYHELESLMAPVSLYDRVRVEKVPGSGVISVTSEGSPHVSGGESNLCHRAARFYFEKTGVKGSVAIEVDKRIPVGAGMGGGSSDAATVIMCLERLFSKSLDAIGRNQAGFEVGADVPFFFAQAPAIVCGIGEQVRPVRFSDRLWMVLVHPGVFLSTAAVFSQLNIGLTTPRPIHTIMQFNFRGIVEGLQNDLEAPARRLEPAIDRAIGMLEGTGAAATMMTGSGSAVFGLFADEAGARAAAQVVGRRAPQGWLVKVIATLGDSGIGEADSPG